MLFLSILLSVVLIVRSTLNDKALSAAVANLVDKVLNKLADKPCTTGILAVEGDSVIISQTTTSNVDQAKDEGYLRNNRLPMQD